MIKTSMLVIRKKASEVRRLDAQSLEILKERGHLKPRPHWIISNDPKQLPWKLKFFYFISGCKEVIEYLQSNNDSFDQIAA